MKKAFAIMLVAAVIGTAVFVQEKVHVVARLGITLNSTKTENESGGITETVKQLSFEVPLSVGYRTGKIGFGLDAAIGGDGYAIDPQDYSSERDVFTLKVGGYFEYALLNTDKFAIFGKAELGYTGEFDKMPTSGYLYRGDQNGFYAAIAPSFEWKAFKHASFFCICRFA